MKQYQSCMYLSCMRHQNSLFNVEYRDKIANTKCMIVSTIESLLKMFRISNNAMPRLYLPLLPVPRRMHNGIKICTRTLKVLSALPNSTVPPHKSFKQYRSFKENISLAASLTTSWQNDREGGGEELNW